MQLLSRRSQLGHIRSAEGRIDYRGEGRRRVQLSGRQLALSVVVSSCLALLVAELVAEPAPSQALRRPSGPPGALSANDASSFPYAHRAGLVPVHAAAVGRSGLVTATVCGDDAVRGRALATATLLAQAVASAPLASVHAFRSPAPDEPPLLSMFLTINSGSIGRRQRASVLSLLRLSGVEVIVFVTEQAHVDGLNLPGGRAAWPTLRTSVLEHGRDTNEAGTPVLSRMFTVAESMSLSRFVGYCNSDLVFSLSLVRHLDLVMHAQANGQLGQRAFLTGRRCNIRASVWCDVFRSDAQDYFIVTRGRMDWGAIPPFVIGRAAYDNWLLFYFLHAEGWATVDLSTTHVVLHLTDERGNFAGHRKGRPDVRYNVQFVNETSKEVMQGRTIFMQFRSVPLRTHPYARLPCARDPRAPWALAIVPRRFTRNGDAELLPTDWLPPGERHLYCESP